MEAKEVYSLVMVYSKFAELPKGVKFNRYQHGADLMIDRDVIWSINYTHVGIVYKMNEGMEELEDFVSGILKGLNEVKAKLIEAKAKRDEEIANKKLEIQKHRAEKLKERISNIGTEVTLGEYLDSHLDEIE
jgi:hypothetical protein